MNKRTSAGAIVIAIVIVLIIITGRPLYIAESQSGTETFTTTMNPALLSINTEGHGNITITVTITTSDPAGLAAGSPVTLYVELSFSPFFFPFGNLTGVSIGCCGNQIVLAPNTEANNDWRGGETGAVFGSYGAVNMEVTVIGSPEGERFAFTPAFIQVQPPIITLEYDTDNFLVGLEIIVIILIAYDIFRPEKKSDAFHGGHE